MAVAKMAVAKTAEKKKAKKAPRPAPDLNKIADSLDSLTTKTEFGKAVAATGVLVEAFRVAGNVPVRDLRAIHRVLNVTLAQGLRTRAGDPKVRKRARLVAQIEKAEARLKELEG